MKFQIPAVMEPNIILGDKRLASAEQPNLGINRIFNIDMGQL